MAVADRLQLPCCINKQETDRALANGLPIPRNNYISPKENPYYDEDLENDLKEIKRKAVIREKKLDKKLRQFTFENALASVPVVDYNPKDALKKATAHYRRLRQEDPLANLEEEEILRNVMKDNDEDKYIDHTQALMPGINLYSYNPKTLSASGSSKRKKKRGSSNSNTTTANNNKYHHHKSMEEELDAAIAATEAGNEDALYQFFINQESQARKEAREEEEQLKSIAGWDNNDIDNDNNEMKYSYEQTNNELRGDTALTSITEDEDVKEYANEKYDDDDDDENDNNQLYKDRENDLVDRREEEDEEELHGEQISDEEEEDDDVEDMDAMDDVQEEHAPEINNNERAIDANEYDDEVYTGDGMQGYDENNEWEDDS